MGVNSTVIYSAEGEGHLDGEQTAERLTLFAPGLAGPRDVGANGEVMYPAEGEDAFTMVALRDISKGEEVWPPDDLSL